MIAKRWLSHCAAGLLDSFRSRSNDYLGYWAPGVLYTETLETGMRVEIDLLAATAFPQTPATGSAASYWSSRLAEAIGRHGGTLDDLETASMSIAFGLPPDPACPREGGLGDLFRCSLRLVSRSGAVVDRERFGYCVPHERFDGRCSTRYYA